MLQMPPVREAVREREVRAQAHETEDRRLQAETTQELPAQAGSSAGLHRDPRRHDRGHIAMSHKKGQGSSRNGRDSNGQRRGMKVFGGQVVTAGSILVRQVGTKMVIQKSAILINIVAWQARQAGQRLPRL